MSGLVGVCLGSGPHLRDMLIRVHPTLIKPAIVKLESNKPLIVDPDGKLVNTHDHHSYNGI